MGFGQLVQLTGVHLELHHLAGPGVGQPAAQLQGRVVGQAGALSGSVGGQKGVFRFTHHRGLMHIQHALAGRVVRSAQAQILRRQGFQKYQSARRVC